MGEWKGMDEAPRDGTLVDLLFVDRRYTDCFWLEDRRRWQRFHSYPAVTQVFMAQPDGWMPRPGGLVRPYDEDRHGRKYVP